MDGPGRQSLKKDHFRITSIFLDISTLALKALLVLKTGGRIMMIVNMLMMMKITKIVTMTPAGGHFWSALEWQQPSPHWSGPGCSTPPCSSQTCSCT